MKIDLKKDFDRVYKHLKKRVKDYPVYVNEGPGEDSDPITQMNFGYQFDQAGWVALVIDTRPDAEPDGQWNSHIAENCLNLDHWFEALEEVFENDSSLTLKTHDGKAVKIDANTEMEELAALFGTMLRDVLLEARRSGLFSSLPLAKQCIMFVEEQGGYYGWPEYDKRIVDGRVQ